MELNAYLCLACIYSQYTFQGKKSICGVIKTIMKMKIIYKSKKNIWPLSLTSFEA